jgi:hypothetical protein
VLVDGPNPVLLFPNIHSIELSIKRFANAGFAMMVTNAVKINLPSFQTTRKGEKK